MPLPYFNLTLQSDAREEPQLSLRERHVAGLPVGGGRPARPKGSLKHGPFCEVRRQRRAATSSDELQPAAWGGGGLRGSVSRKSSAHLASDFRPILSGSGCGVRPGAAEKPKSVFPPEEQAQPKAKPSSPPRVRLTAAPLSLRHIPVARWDFISILLTAK